MVQLILLFVYTLLFHINTNVADKWEKNQELRKKLLDKYDKMAIPNHSQNGTIFIFVGMHPRSVSIDDQKALLIVNAWVFMLWTDPRLVYDPKDFGNLHYVHFGDSELWKPDLTVYNNAEISEVDHYGDTHFLVYPTGEVLWVPPSKFVVDCNMDLKFWPFDQHTCKIDMGSWTSDGWKIDFQLKNSTDIHMGELIDAQHWTILSAKQTVVRTFYECCPEPYPSLHFVFQLRRNSLAFAATVIVPALVFPLFLLVQFLLPVDHPKRLSVGSSCSILVLMELLFLKFTIPPVGTSTPLIMIYYGLTLFVVVLSIAFSAMVGRLSHPENLILAHPPPAALKTILTGPLAAVLCLKFHASKVGLNSQSEDDEGDGEVLTKNSPTNSTTYAHEWLLMAKVLDRLWLITLIFVFIVALLAFVAPVY